MLRTAILVPFSRQTLSARAIHSNATTRILASHRHRTRQAAFSTTPGRRAEEDENFKQYVEISQKLGHAIEHKPEIKQMLKELQQALEDAGLDLTKPPSKLQMFRLLLKSDVRNAAMKVSAALSESGVDVQDTWDQLVAMQKKPKE
ncbi:uncharacterized protein LAESUDRAFT_808596 [Laetiporus sulphureus 93-53]|uniref:Uncharacterized protein n=1 Tax=Laetiporus sulphureus 93-53 TaxID=1314785 RepID=A0A165IIS3_9APHY|nr:uncharacterized protein LAESUDRAFT_808596 [Laetiporus sulphureus 93-53]KZT13134.1 hypothetical protein LAESUDRAFT_808596 [Laetiporus sulphureus 93-53]